MRSSLLAVLLALPAAARAGALSCPPGNTSVSIVCPQTITDLSSPTWSGGHRFINPAHFISSITAAGGIGFSDGTTLTSTGTLHISSATAIPNFSTTQNSFNVCMATVTRSDWTGTRPLRVFGRASWTSTSGTTSMNFAVLEDGAIISPFTAGAFGVGMGREYSGTAGAYHSKTFDYPLRAPSAGSHSYCLTAWTDSGTLSFDDVYAADQFGIEEY